MIEYGGGDIHRRFESKVRCDLLVCGHVSLADEIYRTAARFIIRAEFSGQKIGLVLSSYRHSQSTGANYA
jgi:hypothetical protein